MTFGEKLSRLRKESNYTQEELAEALGVSRQAVSKWESDISYPETQTLLEIGKIFDCSMDYLLKNNILDKGPSSVPKTKIEIIREKYFTDTNKQKAKKALRIIAIALAIILAVDIASMLIYFLAFGGPR